MHCDRCAEAHEAARRSLWISYIAIAVAGSELFWHIVLASTP